MHTNQPLAHKYRETAIRTANPLQLVVMLYDGAMQSLQEAQSHLQSGNITGRVRAVNRAIAIISELQACLNMKEGGAIAESLDRLYSYMKDRIFNGNLHQEAAPFAEVGGLLANLRSAWGEVAVRSRQEITQVSGSTPGAGLIPEIVPLTASVGSFSISG